jgi:biotin synthase-like enzyme
MLQQQKTEIVYYANTIHLFRIRLPNAEINLSPRDQRGRGQGVGLPRLSNLEHWPGCRVGYR